MVAQELRVFGQEEGISQLSLWVQVSGEGMA
jgi:hypothetical protein